MDITPFSEFNSISVTLENHIAHIPLCGPKALNNMIFQGIAGFCCSASQNQ